MELSLRTTNFQTRSNPLTMLLKIQFILTFSQLKKSLLQALYMCPVGYNWAIKS